MKITITDAENGMTIKQYLTQKKFSARLITRLKAKEHGITVNGERRTVRHMLSKGELLELETEDSAASQNIPLSHIPVNVLFEDQWFIAVEKPPHLPIHPSRRHLEDTLASRVMAHFEGKNFVFRVLTRLDLDTSGAVLIAKDSMSAAAFSKMLADRQVKKEYVAVCHGEFADDEGVIDMNIRRVTQYGMEREAVPCGPGNGEFSPEGNTAVTKYSVIKKHINATLVKFLPITGRTHQLRVHAKALGHPMIGDLLYSEPSDIIDRQALHAYSLEFIHPMTGNNIKLTCPLPEDMENCIKELFNE